MNISRNAWMSLLWIAISIIMIMKNGLWSGGFIYVTGAIYFSSLWGKGVLEKKGVKSKADGVLWGLLLADIWLISITVIGGVWEKLNKVSLILCSGIAGILAVICLWHVMRYRKNKH